MTPAVERYVVKVGYETKYIVKIDSGKMVLIYRTRRPCFTSPTSKQINLDYAVSMIINVDLKTYKSYLYISNKIGDDKILAGSRNIEDSPETIQRLTENILNCIGLVKENDRKIILLKKNLRRMRSEINDINVIRKRIIDNKRNRRYNRNTLCKLMVDLFSLGFYKRIPST